MPSGDGRGPRPGRHRACRPLVMKAGDLTTPALLADVAVLEGNLATMSAARPGPALRPHVKAFKTTALAARLVAAGHTGFCCATIREVEGMAAAGLGDDLLLANEVLDAGRLGVLVRAGTARVTVAVDSPATIAAAVAGGRAATAADLEWATGILAAVGEVVVVEEALLDAVTGLSGSGPAYLFLLAEALIDAGEAEGLPRDVAVALTEQTLLGASTLLCRSDDPPATLRENVTSEGGTTAAGLAVFEAGGFRDLVRGVVAAATERSRELGDR